MDKNVRDYVNYIYVGVIFSLFIFVMHNAYSDITKTKYDFFMCTSVVYIFLYIGAAVIDRYISHDSKTVGNTHKNFMSDITSSPGTYILLFMLANIVSCCLSYDFTESFYGTSGRYMGMLAYVIMCLAAFCLSLRYEGSVIIKWIIAVSVFVMNLIAFLQYGGIDVFYLREGIKKKSQIDKFVSTIGNINVYSSAVVLFGAFFFACAVFADRKNKKERIYGIASLVEIFVTGICLFVANSDSGFLGLGFMVFVIFVLSYRRERLCEFFRALSCLLTGCLFVVFVNSQTKDYANFGGIADKLDKLKLVLPICLGVWLITLLAFFIRKKCVSEGLKKGIRSDINTEIIKQDKSVKKNIFTAIIISCFVFAVGGIIAYAKANNVPEFTFNDKWGTYRGYIWKRTADTYMDGGVKEKLFGFGNESIRKIVSEPRLIEMKSITKKVYDNAHNEFLQYLFTLGIFGLISYIGIIVTTLKRSINEKSDMTQLALAMAVLGYVVQSFININQPITTPLLFVFAGMCAGYAKKYKNS